MTLHSFYLAIINEWRPFSLLVNVRLLYISTDGYQYSFLGQVNVTVNSTRVTLFLTDLEFTVSKRDRTRPNETFVINKANRAQLHPRRKVPGKMHVHYGSNCCYFVNFKNILNLLYIIYPCRELSYN
jgi:hypothetical protein